MNRSVTYHITEADASMQILDFLRSKGFSRHILSSMKAEKNAISLNGENAGGRTLLKNHDILNILVPETGSTEHIIPVPMELSVLYEDEDILAVDKPAGMPVHPSMGNYENTLANGSAFYFESKKSTLRMRSSVPIHNKQLQAHSPFMQQYSLPSPSS